MFDHSILTENVKHYVIKGAQQKFFLNYLKLSKGTPLEMLKMPTHIQ